MALHELATNSVKNGALSRPEGRVLISWRMKDGPRGDAVPGMAGERRAGGGGGAGAARRGFGGRVLDATARGQLSGGVTVEWAETGVVCEMEFPLRGRGGWRQWVGGNLRLAE